MKKSEIKNGAILKTRNGMCWFKIDNTLLKVDVKTGVGYNYMPWDIYDEDMKYRNTGYDVVGVDNNANNERGFCNEALAYFLQGKTNFVEVNNDPIIAEEVNYILKFLLATTPFEYIAKDNDETNEIHLYKFEPKKVIENKSSWYWTPNIDDAAPDISNLFVSKESKNFFNSLDPNRVYKIEDLIK